MKPFAMASIIGVGLLLGVGVTAGLALAHNRAPEGPAPVVAVPQEEAQPIPGLAVSVAQDDENPMPEELPNYEPPTLTHRNLGSHLDQLVAEHEESGDQAARGDDASGASESEPVAVTVYLSGNVDPVVQFLEDNGGDPRNVGEDYIEAYVPVSLLGELSERSGVIRVREIQWAQDR